MKMYPICDFAGYIHTIWQSKSFFSPAIWSKRVSFFHEKHRDHLGPPYLCFKLFFLGGNYWDWFEIIDPPNMDCTKYIQISESEINWTHLSCVLYLVCVLFHDFSISSYSWSFMISHVEAHCRCAERCWWLWWRHDEQLVNPQIFFLVIPLFIPANHCLIMVECIECILNAYWMLVFEISWDVFVVYSSSSIIGFTWRLWKWQISLLLASRCSRLGEVVNFLPCSRFFFCVEQS